MKKKDKLMWVDDDFHRFFKQKAAEKGVSMTDLSRQIAKKGKKTKDDIFEIFW